MRVNKRAVKNLSLIILVLGGLFTILSLSFNVNAAVPYGAEVYNVSPPETAPADVAGNDSAYAGNVSELGIFSYSTTQAWQGYFGNITGTIQLADADDNVMYNWSVANPKGQIYASKNQTVFWPLIQCFNFTAIGTYASDAAQAGATSLFGTNFSLLESEYSINYTDDDGVNETFVFYGAGNGHVQFYTASHQFSTGECRSTRVYDSTGTGVQTQFEEVLLYEPTTTSVVFTSLIENNFLGFDQRQHDFEMLVLEDGHGTDVAATPYYFFVELQ